MAQFYLCFRVAFLVVFLPLTSGACVDLDLGMGSGAISDSEIAASSEQSANTPARNGRLNFTSGSSWCAGTNDTNPYLQIDLRTLHIICAVSTQGNSQADQWVKTYTLQLSTDGITWTDYKELGGQAKALEGNKDRNSNVKHVLYGVLTRYLRFLPQTHLAEVCMRTEVFGVQQKPTCDSQAIGLASGGRIPDDSFSASSIYNSRYKAKYGRLNGTGAWEPKTTTDPDDYLQIDLLYEYVICAVATQGNPPTQSVGAQEWTTEYKLRFSLHGTPFFPYKENKIDKAFPGNSGKTDTVKNSLKEFASAKFIRFLPTKYNVFKALRVEAYGILFSKVPSQPPTAFKLTATSSTRIAASWQLPPVFARHGRNITGFKLFYKKKGFGGSATTLAIRRGSILSENVSGLDKYTEYEFQVLAFTSDGDGPKSSVVVERTMEDVPSQAPESLTVTAGTSTIVTASWQLPPLDSRNGIITGFKLFYKKKTASGSLAMLRMDNGTIHDKTVIGLDNNTEYEFQVLAFTSAGDGPKSSPVVVRTMKDGGCVDFYLGMGSGTIPDSNINASSVKSASTPAENGRLNYMSGSSWCAGTSDTNPYLQIDLQTLHIICAVSTQGNSQADEWVKTYTLQLSTNGITWTNYKELGGQVKVLEGNKDRNSSVKHVLYGVLTRYLRFLPQTHQGEVCMRTEMFGVQQKPTCDSQAIGLASSGRIPDDSFSASSIFTPRYAAKYGRLNGRGAWEPKTTNDPDDYLQIDLLYEYVICAVATQGNPPTQSASAQEWTTEYKLRLSLNGTTFFPYKENNIDKIFPGNAGKTDTVKNSLKEFVSAQFIRIQPTGYHGYKVLRVEVYGILLTKVPSQPPTAFKLTTSSSTSIKASWQLPPVFARHGRNITGFKLFYKKKGSGQSFTTSTICSGATLSRNVTGLKEYTEYEFQVLAYTSDGVGPKSPVEVERTKEDVPSQAPSSFTVTSSTSTIVTASWELPPVDSRNGIITGFKLFYKKKTVLGSFTMLRIDNGAIHDKTVIGLDKYTEYEFLALAFTSIGDGPKSSPVVVKTMKDGGCVEFYLGMENGAIPDNKITASSEQSSNTPAKNGRLNYTSGSSWCARASDIDPHLQIDLQTFHIICAVSTQGNFQANHWVRNYSLQFSTNGTTWKDYKEDGQVKFLSGNNDRNSEVKHVVYGVLTRYVRFLPHSYQSGVCMRTEVFGVKQTPTCQMEAIGLVYGGEIPDSSFTASSFANYRYQPFLGRLYGRLNGWAPKTNADPADYLQIDLLSEYVICAVATQGANSMAMWTKNYTIQLSLDGTTFATYNEDSNEKVFSGNSNYYGTIKNSLREFASAKFIRFQPKAYSNWKALRVEVYGVLLSKAPSRAPINFNVTASSSTSIAASWHFPPDDFRHGVIKGFKLFYQRKGFPGSATHLNINGRDTLTTVVTGLYKYTEYIFQVLAYTSGGDGPKSCVEVERTLEDAPSAPAFLSYTDVPPSKPYGPRIKLTWTKPVTPNGIIRSYTLFYSHGGDVLKEISGIDALNYTIGVLGGVVYELYVRAVTVKPGPNITINLTTREYEPSVGPDSVSASQMNKTTFNISWERLPRAKSFGKVILYEVKANLLWKSHFYNWSAHNNVTVNTSSTFVFLPGLLICSEYNVSVRAYTGAGPGPYGEPLELVTRPKAPGEFRVTDFGKTQVTLTWKQFEKRESIIYTVSYNGTKSYNKIFKHVGTKLETNLTTYTVRGLFPGTSYKFDIYGSSDCGQTAARSAYITTDIMAPRSPLPLNMTDVEVSETTVDIYLWPVEQENGPVSAYQVIVLKVAEGVEELPGDYGLQLNSASDAKKDDVNFYIAAEIENVPLIDKPWKFTVGDGEKTANYVNGKLESGENYIVYERALTKTKDVILEGKASKVAKITISPGERNTRLNQEGRYRDLLNKTS